MKSVEMKFSRSTGWRVEEVLGVVVRVCRHKIRIKVWMDGKGKFVSVDPDNLTIKGSQ